MQQRMAFRKLLTLALLAGGLVAGNAAESLYQVQTARKIDPGMVSLFGPRAEGIRYDNRMIRAAQIAQARARGHSVARCWRYVKEALLAADVIEERPTTAYAKQAGEELVRKFGFRRLRVSDPYRAPIGSILVYGGRGAGHVEFRTLQGFVSDFVSPKPSKRPLIGVYVKPS
jgi:hypothetical protein